MPSKIDPDAVLRDFDDHHAPGVSTLEIVDALRIALRQRDALTDAVIAFAELIDIHSMYFPAKNIRRAYMTMIEAAGLERKQS